MRDQTLRQFWNETLAPSFEESDDPPYSDDQKALLRYAFYSGAKALLDLYRSGRDEVVYEARAYTLRSIFDISLPPSPGPLLEAWHDLAHDGRFATPWDVKLYDLYRATFYNGATFTAKLMRPGVRAVTLLREATTFVRGHDPRPTTAGPKKEYGVRTFTGMWDDIVNVAFKTLPPGKQDELRQVFYAGARTLRRLQIARPEEIDSVINEIEDFLIAWRFLAKRRLAPGLFNQAWHDIERRIPDTVPDLVKDGIEEYFYLGAMALVVVGTDAPSSELNRVLN